MCDFIARTNWSKIKSNYFVHTIIIFNLSYYTYITITVTFMNQPMLCHAFFFFPPKYYLHKSCTIFHINLYVFNIHTEIPNGTNKLNHVKRSAVFQNEPFGIPYRRMNHLCRDWNKRMLTIVWNTICNCHAGWLPLVNERFVTDKLVAISTLFFWTWCDKRCCQAQLHHSNTGQWFFVWVLFIRQAHHYQNQWNTALMEAAVVSIMQTLAITLWFPEQCLLGVIILEKQLASQDMFLIRSELSITAYLFLVLYRFTSLKSRLCLKNVKTFLCK